MSKELIVVHGKGWYIVKENDDYVVFMPNNVEWKRCKTIKTAIKRINIDSKWCFPLRKEIKL